MTQDTDTRLVDLVKGHTPGPWVLVDNRNLNGAYWICAPDEFTSHAEVRAGCGEADEAGDMRANAVLIAEAPAMLARIESLRAEVARLRRCFVPLQMMFAQAELVDEPIPDDAVVLHFMGSGASDQVTAGEIRTALGDHQ